MKLFELRLSLKELNKSKKELQSLNITKDKLFSIISHDLRGPIGGLKSFVQLLISTRDLTDVKTILKDLKAIQANAASTFDLLENLLAWSISQQNHIKCTPVSIDLYERVDSIINLFTGLSQTKDIRIINAIEKGMLIHADKDMISTIIRNLLSNAIKFTPNGKKITIGCEVNEKGVCVYITDEGKGLDDLHLKRLFRKSDYFTTYGTNGEKGSGLGLLLCKDFIEKHNGEIGVKTKVGKGSTFHFSIPQ
jgi:signal transduction histidine kinase